MAPTTTPLLTTKLNVPPVRPVRGVVQRPRLIEQLNEGLRAGRKLSLIPALAGFGKTTLVSEWIHCRDAGRGVGTGAGTAPVQPLRYAWLSLDEKDNDPTRYPVFPWQPPFCNGLLVEEVLKQQSERIQTFLLQTAILDRLTGSLCDAVRFGSAELPTDRYNGQAILEMLEHANLFIVPLDGNDVGIAITIFSRICCVGA